MTSSGRIVAVLAVVLAVVSLAGPAGAGKKDDTLNIAWEKELETLNLYYQTAREGVILGRHIFDRLLYRDPESGEYKPALAKSYRWIISEQAYAVPLFTWVANYAYSKELDFKAWPDEIPRFFMAKWK